MFIFKMLLICIICARILVNVCVAELLSYLQLISLRLSFGKNSKPICNKTQLKYANKCIVRPHRMHVHSSTFALCGRRCLASSVGHGCYHITQELQWFCFTSRTQHLLAEDKTTEHLFLPYKPPDISVDGNTVESVNSFVYLGSLQSSDGQCRPDLTRRIGLACAVMTSLKRIWSDKRLILDTKLRIYQGAYNQDAGYIICVRGHTGQHLSRRPK